MSVGAAESTQGGHMQVWRSSILLTEQANQDVRLAGTAHCCDVPCQHWLLQRSKLLFLADQPFAGEKGSLSNEELVRQIFARKTSLHLDNRKCLHATMLHCPVPC